MARFTRQIVGVACSLAIIGCATSTPHGPRWGPNPRLPEGSVRVTRGMSSTERCQTIVPVARRASRLHMIELHLLLAVIRVESNFKPWAVSRVGARGLMQLMPETAKGNGVTDPHDVVQNVFGGAMVLRRFIEYYNGDVRYGLAAYNAGYVKTNRAFRRGVLPGNFQSYVRKVLDARDRLARYGCGLTTSAKR
ncbi:MAG: transglycosylase SLT domain-containing protein [Myxococcales bacterium]|nr:transglycosylase SLT domain-containing protein [Myxococcales bacterium]